MFSPSELPIGATISYLGADFTKHKDGNWYSPFAKPLTSEAMAIPLVKIISFPFEIVVRLAEEVKNYEVTEWHSNPDGTPFTTEAVIRDVIEEHNGKNQA